MAAKDEYKTMIRITQNTKGFPKTEAFLRNASDVLSKLDLERYGQKGVEALRQATPYDTGKTAESWSYTVIRTKTHVGLSFSNSNVNDGVPIAILLEYGHGTKNGVWVEGRDYINPAVKPIFDQIEYDLQKGVDRL